MCCAALLCALLGAPLAAAESAGAAADEGAYARGEEALLRGDVVGALQAFRGPAQRGHAASQVQLAEILDAAEDDAAALDWYRRAADAGHAEGAYGVGKMYASGEGVARDAATALDWFERASRGGSDRALSVLVSAHAAGQLGLTADPARARALLESAVDGGSAWAARRLARAHADGQLGLPVDAGAAQRWRERAATLDAVNRAGEE